MSALDGVSSVRAAYTAYNTRDFDAAAERYSEELELHNVATGEVYRGREGYLQYARSWAAAFPDSRVEIGRVTGHAHSATVEYVARGTHTGTLITSHGHIPPTWMQVELRFCDTLQLRDGLITRASTYFDTGSLLRQMGLLPNSPLHAPDRRAPLDLYALEMDAPAQQRNKAVVQRFIDRVLNQHDPAAAAELCVPNLAWHGGPLGEIRDLASFQQVLAALFLAFPDLKVEVEDAIAEEDRVSARLLLRGTHRGDFQGIPPTGKPILGTGTSTYRVVDGKIVEEWWQQDLFSVMKQLDVMPAIVRPSSAGDP